MLDEIRRLHEELLSAIVELERLAAAPAPDRTRLGDVRWKLSRASGRRTRMLDELHPRLIERASPAEAQKLSALRTEQAAQRAASTAHIVRWTLDRALADWPDYRAASAAMTTAMRRRIATEKATLYPLLDRIGSDEAAGSTKR